MSGAENNAEPVLRVHELSVRFRRRDDAAVRAVAAASFDAYAGECVALVGESGCGKSMLTSALVGLLPAGAEISGSALLRDNNPTPGQDSAGSASWGDAPRGLDVLAAGERVLRERVRGRMVGLIPQSPLTSLTPVRTIRSQLAETLHELGRTTTVEAAGARAHFPTDHLDRYPHELSGGLAQRAVTALALAGEPRLLLADEPTTGLDRPLVAETMRALREMTDRGRTVLLVTHDLAAAHSVADRIAVMYAGRIVEISPTAGFFDHPAHPYSRALLDALPERGFTPIPGKSPELTRLPTGCVFRPRCPRAGPGCDEAPRLADLPGDGSVACWHPDTATPDHRWQTEHATS